LKEALKGKKKLSIRDMMVLKHSVNKKCLNAIVKVAQKKRIKVQQIKILNKSKVKMLDKIKVCNQAKPNFAILKSKLKNAKKLCKRDIVKIQKILMRESSLTPKQELLLAKQFNKADLQEIIYQLKKIPTICKKAKNLYKAVKKTMKGCLSCRIPKKTLKKIKHVLKRVPPKAMTFVKQLLKSKEKVNPAMRKQLQLLTNAKTGKKLAKMISKINQAKKDLKAGKLPCSWESLFKKELGRKDPCPWKDLL